eukprot:TRINITY_DN7446_c0_g2_i1.p1 TRINITY_DN7446_c0_g2~~TRINITY_DN7446_c0_g2_i1.p1  ORF type:complete len:462 (+),score=44.46 TRINITY_DN7446_c0_g2_i1:81-1466(+)
MSLTEVMIDIIASADCNNKNPCTHGWYKIVYSENQVEDLYFDNSLEFVKYVESINGTSYLPEHFKQYIKNNEDTIKKRSLFTMILIIFICFMTVTMQITAAAITQEIELNQGFNQPYFLNYFGTSLLCICFLFQLVYYIFTKYYKERISFEVKDFGKGYIQLLTDSTTIPFKKLFLYALPLCILWFLANFLFTLALSMTNIASSLTLEQSTTIFVFFLSIIFLKEKATIIKALAVLICIIGVVCIGIGDQISENDTNDSTSTVVDSSDNSSFFSLESLLGDGIILCSSAAAATYMITYKKLLFNLPVAIPAVNTLLGSIGVWNVILFCPGILYLFIAKKIVFDDFSTLIVFLIVISSICALLFNYFLNWGIILTSPLSMRLVIVFGIPVSFILNYFTPDYSFSYLRIIGAICIIIGFIIYNIHTYRLSLKPSINQEKQSEKNSNLTKNDEILNITIDNEII